MADLKKDITALRDPSNIKKAFLASSPYVLRKVFAADPIIQRLIRAGEKVVPLITEETRGERRLEEITLAAFAYIIENVKADAAPQILGARFKKSMEKPGPFFVHFAAHAMRSGFQMPVKPLEMVYSQAELIETQNKLQ
jgi:hypothetical protein